MATRGGVGRRARPATPLIVRCGLHQASEYFRNAPGLSDATARRVGCLGIEDLADRSDARLAHVLAEALEHLRRSGTILGVRTQPGVDERADEPSPDGSLMVGGVARAEVAEVLRLNPLNLTGMPTLKSCPLSATK